MSDFNLSNILIALESGGCEGVTVQELEFALDYINKGLRNKVCDYKQEPVAWAQRRPVLGLSISLKRTVYHTMPLYTNPSNIHRLRDGDIVRINNKSGSIFSKAYAIMDACGIPKGGE